MLEEDRLEPLVVNDMEEYERLIAPNKLQNSPSAPSPTMEGLSSPPLSPRIKKEEATDVEFPQSYGFSILVPQFYDHVRKFVAEFYQFANDLSDTDQYIIKSTDMLIKALSHTLITTMEQVSKPSF